MIITIDGPAGSGKSTIAVKLAQKLKAAYLDTGSMYRAVTLAALEKEVSLDDPEHLIRMVAGNSCEIQFARQDNADVVCLNGKDVTQAIRDPQVTAQAHKLASVPEIRDILVAQQRQIAEKVTQDAQYNYSLVTEGRDQGTVVFPDARFKFYLDATSQCRAMRRWKQLSRDNITLEEVLKAQQQRDKRDTSRKVSPLKPAPGAIVIDTTDLTIAQTTDKLYDIIKENKKN